MKNRIEWLSGVVSMASDMCPNSCMAYTGPLADRTTCLYCNTARYKTIPETETTNSEVENDPDEAAHVPMQQFHGPCWSAIAGSMATPQQRKTNEIPHTPYVTGPARSQRKSQRPNAIL